MIETKAIKVEGNRIDPVRDVPRLWLEVEPASKGVVVQGHRVSGPTRIQVYADQLSKVRNMVRTDSDNAAYAQAHKLAQGQIDAWKQANAKALGVSGDPEGFMRANCNVSAEQHLANLGYRTGLPPLLSCKVVHPGDVESDSPRTIDVSKFVNLPEDKRGEWLVDPPATAGNAQRVAMDRLADTLGKSQADLITMLAELLQGGAKTKPAK